MADSVITLSDVAAAAGVSLSTASKALNGTDRISEATREHVRVTADRLGFRHNALARSFARRGIKVETGRTVTGIAPAGDQAPPLVVTVADPDGGNPREVEADVVLVGVGRRPNTAELGLERAGVATDLRGWVEVDERLRTGVPGVHAVGDVTGRVLLAHVASHQGLVAAGVMAGHLVDAGASRTTTPHLRSGRRCRKPDGSRAGAAPIRIWCSTAPSPA